MAVIAIYDSGVGGLSVYQDVVARCPEHDYIFVGDNQQFPYGRKPEGELRARVQAVLTRLDEHHCIDILILACNTASTIVLPSLRETFDFPIIGVVPAIKPAAEISITRRIALLATHATVARSYTDQLIAEFASDCHIVKLGSSELVQLAEDKLFGREFDESIISIILKPIIADAEIDCMVLACTHFPLLKEEIKSELKKHGRQPHLLDSGEAIANRLVFMSQSLGLEPSESSTRVALMTDNTVEPGFVAQLERMGFSELQHLIV